MSGNAKRIAVITGASGGLGKEFVKQVIDDVDEIWAVGRNVEKLEGLKSEFGSKIVPLQMDLSDAKSLSKLSKKIEAEEKKSSIQIHWLINNAGAGRFGASKDFTTEEISVSITTHCTAIAAICNICIPCMKAGDHIVNVSSQSAFSPLPYMNLYAATKAFVYSYTRALGEELRDTGIVVTAVCPGWIQTALLPDTLNGRKVKFPLIVTADKVAEKAIKDARRGKPLSVYRFAVRLVAWLQRHTSNDFSVKFWAKSVKKYL
ncbi:MAG: SDR family NAD(P)-dependent oxidoreductase [Treponema sp.]|nr:SDR family NAD(P)-dependent oxidoreductase [Treponema sp.]